MYRPNPWKTYQHAATQTASPGQLILMLYDGAIRFLNQAEQGFQLEDPADFNQTINNNILRAQAIISELNYSLNMAQGGELARKMRSLYDYFDRKLMDSNLRKDSSGVQEVNHRLQILRNAWAEMLQGRGQEASANVEYSSMAATA
ncbi:MAG TPA: flagellar export chaperone FliS [Candidatus Paceibacterota bacterium]|nr:flagellar export chaperone FliS [Verrucomicrobiota bacterium]HRY48841.1 flagellar export chaperone FliS [Candidatus Paceibacterota bacterium]